MLFRSIAFVAGWILCLGLGWAFQGAGLLTSGAICGALGGLELLAGLCLLTEVGARTWLPSYGPRAPGLVVFLAQHVGSEFGIPLGFLASGILAWKLSEAP